MVSCITLYNIRIPGWEREVMGGQTEGWEKFENFLSSIAARTLKAAKAVDLGACTRWWAK